MRRRQIKKAVRDSLLLGWLVGAGGGVIAWQATGTHAWWAYFAALGAATACASFFVRFALINRQDQ